MITSAFLSFNSSNEKKDEIYNSFPKFSDKIANPALKKIASFFDSSPMDMTGILPIGQMYKLTKGAIPRFIDLIHGTPSESAEAVARGGILNKLDRAKAGIKEFWEDGETLNYAHQPDAVYLANKMDKAKQYGDVFFKARVNPAKLRPDDDFLTDLSFSAKESGYIPPEYQSVLNRLGKDVDPNDWVKLDNQIYDDFLKNPNADEYKKLVPKSLDYGQVAMQGSIPPYRIRSVKADHDYDLFSKLLDYLEESRPTLRR